MACPDYGSLRTSLKGQVSDSGGLASILKVLKVSYESLLSCSRIVMHFLLHSQLSAHTVLDSYVGAFPGSIGSPRVGAVPYSRAIPVTVTKSAHSGLFDHSVDYESLTAPVTWVKRDQLCIRKRP